MLALAGGIVVLLSGTGIYMSSALEGHLTGEFDTALLAKAHALAALTDTEAGRIEFDYGPEDMPEFERSERPEYFQFWLDDGAALLRSSRLDRDLPRWASLQDRQVIDDVDLPDGRAGRMVQLAYFPKGPGDVDDDDEPAPAVGDEVVARALILAVARERRPLDQLLADVRNWLVAVGGVVGLLAVLLVWRTLAIGFRPIASIASQVRALDADSLDARVDLPPAPSELAPIVDQLNDLLHRLDTTFQRERRFADNVAHELRTPIAELRSLATVAAEWPDDRVSVVRFFDDVKEIAGHMEGVIGDLLLLARCQAGIEQVSTAPTSLMHLITSAWSKLAPRASEAGIRLHLDLGDDVIVESDPGKLSIILANLLGNAVDHALAGSEVRVVGSGSGPRFQLQVLNSAELLSDREIEHLTEPFWRKEQVGSTANHAGLGLSLVTALAALLHLDVRISQDAEGVFGVRLSGLPVCATRPDSHQLRQHG